MDVKDATHARLLDVYRKHGKDVAVQVARKSLGMQGRNRSAEFKTNFNGEVCETVLEILVDDYCKRHPKQTAGWCWGKGIILKDPGRLDKDFTTELDFTLFTPEKIYLFECKSYAGDKILCGAGTLERQGREPFDVYKQSLLHVETLDKWIGRTSRSPDYQMVLFNFSRGKVTDKRTASTKELFPCVDETDWVTVLKGGKAVWDTKYLQHVVEVLTENSGQLQEEHVRYVQSLHGK